MALESARQLGHDVTVIALEEEASKNVEALAPRCYWISLGQLGKLIDILKKEGISQVMMCGQVKHARIFSSIVPDWRLVKLLASLSSKNTDGLIGGVVKVLADEGIHLSDSTALLKPLLATAGAMTRRKPTRKTKSPISNTAAEWLTLWPGSMWDRAQRFASAPAWHWKRWKARMPCCAAPPAW